MIQDLAEFDLFSPSLEMRRILHFKANAFDFLSIAFDLQKCHLTPAI
jgi:hypothetical protein